MLLDFECTTGKSLTHLYTGGADMGLTFIHRPNGYEDIYIRDEEGLKHAASMIGACWLAFPVRQDVSQGIYFMLHFKELPPFLFNPLTTP